MGGMAQKSEPYVTLSKLQQGLSCSSQPYRAERKLLHNPQNLTEAVKKKKGT
jgi:hypothetical protein